MEKIAFIGLGIMGKPMALNLVKAGYSVYVYGHYQDVIDELVAAGAKAATSEAEAAANADVSITMVQNGPQVEQAVLGTNGILTTASKGDLIIDMSSIAPTVAQQISAKCAERGVDFLEAPVSGGEPGAINGALAIMAGGSQSAFERARPIFDVLGKSAVLCGGSGAGNATKLANQIIVAANIYALSEALVLTSKVNVDPETVFNAIKGGLAGSAVMNAKAPMMCEGNFNPGFRIKLHHKDISNAIDTGRELGIPLELSDKLHQILTYLMNEGHSELDHSAILKYVEAITSSKLK